MASSTLLPASMMPKLDILESSGITMDESVETATSDAADNDVAGHVDYWTKVLSDSLKIANGGSETARAIDEAVMEAPRRSSRGALASRIAARLYSAQNERSSPITQYEKDIVMLRKLVIEQRRKAIAEATTYNAQHDWTKRIRSQGAWDETNDPLSTAGAPSLPMPVEVSDKDSLAPFFAHLRNGGTSERPADSTEASKSGLEPWYNVELIEFEKGVLYSDGRVDLCKMVTGPRNIWDLMDSLKGNPFSKHFLLGNNIIGPTGAKAIASFIDEYPGRFETWYLAGNCIDTASFGLMVDSMVKSPVITNVWLKRNPLLPSAANVVVRLITQLPALRTLDLDQTELGDDGVAEIFNSLADYEGSKALALRHVYLNATGVSEKACKAIGRYLKSPACRLVSLFMSSNPIGDNIAHLSSGLERNSTLERLVLQSCGLKCDTTDIILNAAVAHTTLKVLDLGQGYATEDLGMRYNWLTSTEILKELVQNTSLQYLNVSYTPMTQAALNPLLAAIANSPSMLWFSAKPLIRGLQDAASVHAGQEHARLLKVVRERLRANVKQAHGVEYEKFESEQKRFLLSPRDVRLIDSVYRNRDAGMARRGLKKLEKLWAEGDETLRQVREESFV